MKRKFMKKIIAVICAATMTTACGISSVGAIKISSFDYGTQRERLVKDLNVDIGRVTDKLDDFIKQIEAYEKTSMGKNDKYVKVALETLKEAKQLFKDINYFKLCHYKLIRTVKLNLDIFHYAFLEGMLGVYNKDRARYVVNDYGRNDIIKDLTDIKRAVQFSTKLDDKRVALHQAGLFINGMDDSKEKSNLQQCYNEAQNYYNSIESTIELGSEGEKQAQRFFELSDKVINEIKTVKDSQKNDNINLEAPPLVEN